jgi:phosphoglucosamine mutase
MSGLRGSWGRSATRRLTSHIKACEARLNGSGRLLVRKSGTEPVIRIMGEGEDEKLVRQMVREIAASDPRSQRLIFPSVPVAR